MFGELHEEYRQSQHKLGTDYLRIKKIDQAL
jgi:hypothetical protein